MSGNITDFTALPTEQMREELIRVMFDIASDEEHAGKFARFIRQFHNYSVFNRLMIYHQNPDATRVAGFRTWKSTGRFVRKGERGMKIIAPRTRKKKETDQATGEEKERIIITGFIPVTVFDISQTDKTDDAIDLESPVVYETPDAEELYHALTTITEKDYELREISMDSAIVARLRNGNQIEVNSPLPLSTRCYGITRVIAQEKLEKTDSEHPRAASEVAAMFALLAFGVPRGAYEVFLRHDGKDMDARELITAVRIGEKLCDQIEKEVF